MKSSLIECQLTLVRVHQPDTSVHESVLCAVDGETLELLLRAGMDLTLEKTGRDVSSQTPADLSGPAEYYPLLERSPIQENAFTYGILALVPTADGQQRAAAVHDVSTDLGLVHALTVRFTSFQLSPIHLKDAVLDALS